MEMKSSRTDQKVMNPKVPRFMLTILKDTQKAAADSGMKRRQTSTTEALAIPTEDSVPGTNELCCSANWKTMNAVGNFHNQKIVVN
jgi:hypothetical protein